MHRWHYAKFYLLAGLVGLLFVSCRPRETRVEEATRAGILLMDNGTEPATLDPHLASGEPERRVIMALFEGLVIPHPEIDGDVLPGVAERWEHDTSATIWTFHLRPEAKWSDGTPVTATDFVRSYQRMLSSTLAADFATMLFRLENAEAYYQGTLTDFSQVGVRAIDEHTLQLRLVGPTPYFLTLASHYAWGPVPVDVIARHGELTSRSPAWTKPGAIVGNGPFILTRWQPDQIIQVRPNPHYWDRKALALRGIDFFPIVDDAVSVRQFDAGELHLTHTLPTEIYQRRQAAGDPHLVSGKQLGTYYYFLNTQIKPLDDARVRQALSLAINRDELVEHVTRGGERPATRFVPDGFTNYPFVGGLPYDPEQARRLLAEAGYPGGQGWPSVTLLYNTLAGHQRIAEAITHRWQQELGITVGLENVEWKTFLERRDRGDFEIGRAGWVADYYDPLTFLEIMITPSNNNDAQWSRPDYDAAVAAAFREADPERRNTQMAHAETILLDDLPIIPIYFYSRRWLQHPAVQGWHHKALDDSPYQFVSLEGAETK